MRTELAFELLHCGIIALDRTTLGLLVAEAKCP